MCGVELGSKAGVDRDQSIKWLRGAASWRGKKPDLDPTPQQRRGTGELGRGHRQQHSDPTRQLSAVSFPESTPWTWPTLHPL